MIVTGGGGEHPSSSELLLSDGTPWCKLPSLPVDDMFGHTQSGLVACGGYYTRTSCFTFSGGQWVTSHSLLHERVYHSSWSSSQHGTILMGGMGSETSTEMLTDNGESQESFTLKYDAR